MHFHRYQHIQYQVIKGIKKIEVIDKLELE